MLAAAVAVPAALAAGGEPQHQFTKADQAKARKASLRLSDFAAGWTAKPDTSSSNASPKCKTYNPDQSDLVETGKYNSPDFSHSNGSFVSTTTGVFKTVAMAKTGYARVATPQLPKCFGELLGKQAKTTVYAAGPLTFPKVGERSNAYRLSVGIDRAGDDREGDDRLRAVQQGAHRRGDHLLRASAARCRPASSSRPSALVASRA